MPQNDEISINYVDTEQSWDRNKIIPDNKFAFTIALDVIEHIDDPEPQSIE